MKIVDESILFFYKILFGNSQHFMGMRAFIVVCMRNVKSQFQPNRAFWRLELATGTSHEFESRANYLAKLEVFSCSAPVVMTLQLLQNISHVCHSSDLPNARLF